MNRTGSSAGMSVNDSVMSVCLVCLTIGLSDGFVCHVCLSCLSANMSVMSDVRFVWQLCLSFLSLGMSDIFVCHVCLSGLSDVFVCAATQRWRMARGCMHASAPKRWENWLEDLATWTGILLEMKGQLTPLQNWRC